MTKNFICPPLNQWQKDLFDAIIEAGPKAGNIFCVKSMRQVGKSFVANLILIYHAITYANSTSFLLSITYKNCRKIFEELSLGLRDFPLVEHVDKMDMRVTFKNGSSISFFSSISKENLRGNTVKGGGILIIDEAAYLSEDIFGIVFPFVNVSNANILMVSTPRLRQGQYYEYYQAGLSGEHQNVKSFNWSEYDVSALLSPERIEMYSKLLPPAQFQSEVMGNFIDDIAGVFPLAGVFHNRSKMPTELPKDIFVGIDWALGKGQDYTVVSGFDSDGNQVLLDYFNKLEPEQQLERIAGLLNSLKTKLHVKAEQNSLGSVYLSRLQALCPNTKINPFNTYNQSKREIVEYLASRMSQQRCTLINDAEQYAQMSAYQMEITKSGLVTYNGAIGNHDDICIANSIAMSWLMDLEKRGNYTLGLPQRPHKNTFQNKYG